MTNRDKQKKEKRYADARRRDREHGGDFVPTSYKVPDGMERFRWKEAKKYRIDVVPYVVGKGTHPRNSGGPNPYADTGEEYYERTFWTHANIGGNPRNHYCCPLKNFGKRCPVCEYCEHNRGDKELYKSLGPKERQMWLFVDRDAKDKGIQIFESAYFMSFGEQIHEFREGAEDDDPRLDFWHLDDGMTLEIKVKEHTWAGGKNMKPVRIDFVPRRGALEIDAKKVPCLDSLLIEKSYEEMEALLNATGSGKDKDDESQDSSADESGEGSQDSDASGTDNEEGSIKVGAMVKHVKLGLCEVVHVSGDGTSLKLEDKKGKVHNGIDPDDCELEEEGEPNALDHYEDEKKDKKKPAKEESEDSEVEDSDAGSDDDSDAGSDDASAEESGDESQDSDAGSEDASGEDSADADVDSDEGSWEPSKPAKKPAAKKPAPKKPSTPAKKPGKK